MENPNVIEMKQKGKELMKAQGKPFLFGGVIVVLFLLFSKAFTVVPAGYVGVKDFFGKVTDETLPSGFHVINPLFKIHKMDIRTQELSEATNVPSQEGLTINLDVTLLYSLNPEKASGVYKTIGPDYHRVVVVPQLRSAVRGVTASYDAKALYTSAREAIADEMQEQLIPNLDERGIRVEKILLRSVTLPDILSTAIEKKLEAEQQSQQMKFVLEREEQEASRKRVEAKGVADFQRIVNQGLTPSYLRWKGIEATKQLADSKNTKIVVIGSGKDGLPLILGGDSGQGSDR